MPRRVDDDAYVAVREVRFEALYDVDRLVVRSLHAKDDLDRRGIVLRAERRQILR